MNPPTQMIDRWADRLEPGPEEANLYWHILLKDIPHVRAWASAGQRKLSSFNGLHFTPGHRLHITILTLGSAHRFAIDRVTTIISEAGYLLSQLPPISVTMRKVLYHPEAIAVRVEPSEVLNPIRDAVLHATLANIERNTKIEGQAWIPHVTLAYSTAVQPAAPLIAALGSEMPVCEVYVKAISLVAQEGAERQWRWRSLAEVPLGGLA